MTLMNRAAVTGLGFAIATLMDPDRAAACSCVNAPGPPCRLGSESVTFVGLVQRIVPRHAAERGIHITFRVDEAFAGVTEKTIAVSTDNTSCGVTFEVGRSYLVDAFKQRSGQVSVSICSNTDLAENAAIEIALLREIRSGKVRPRIYGWLTEVRGPIFDDSFDARHLFAPMRGIRVTAVAPGVALETMTDGDGLFLFEDVAGGRYRVIPELPRSLELLPAGPGFHRADPDPSDVQITGCSVRLALLASRRQRQN